MIGVSERVLGSIFMQNSALRDHSSQMPDYVSLFLLTPASLLTQKASTLLSPSGAFHNNDLHCQQWMQVQHLANCFWKRWRHECLHTLQRHSKWQDDRPNIQEVDLVPLKDKQVKLNEWPMVTNATFPLHGTGSARLDLLTWIGFPLAKAVDSTW
ncbi:hypothetical protein N1851_009403 [Merluccius polli]|uniref:DUF5641 domain-containing protein n=1 Tax=Merluccius polli TaxID=89951 RepID=A0AA47P717_MERPO|nr:hypothetical protein N1851_009403 [Merluccius polli]